MDRLTLKILYGILKFMYYRSHVSPFFVTEVDVKNPVVDVTPVPLAGFSSSRDIVSCERVLVAGLSRLKLWSYSSAYHVTLIPSAAIPERLHGKIQICSHK